MVRCSRPPGFRVRLVSAPAGGAHTPPHHSSLTPASSQLSSYSHPHPIHCCAQVLPPFAACITCCPHIPTHHTVLTPPHIPSHFSPHPPQSTVSSGGWWDLFWAIFLPYTHFHFKFLPTMTQKQKEPAESFVKRGHQVSAPISQSAFV